MSTVFFLRKESQKTCFKSFAAKTDDYFKKSELANLLS